MRILFINFNLGATAGINNGLAVLSSVLKRKGHDVGLIFLCEEMGYDFNLKRIKKDIVDFNSDIIGISLVETQLKYMVDFCKDLRTYYKGFVVCGGAYPTMASDDVLSIKEVDAVCVGEGEDAIAELADKLANKEDYKTIKNLWIRMSDGKIVKNRLRGFKRLADLPREDKELFDLNKLLSLKNFQLEQMLGRGCVYKCSYCINDSYVKKYESLCDDKAGLKDYIRVKDINTVIGEMEECIKNHPKIRKVALIDDNLLMYGEDFLKDFCRVFKERINLPFMCNANPLSYTYSKARILKEYGCDDVRFGVESGSERVKNDILTRPIPNKSVVDAFNINKKLGMMTSSFNMIGLPTETKDEVFETINLNAQIMPDTVKLMTFYPFKNTPIYDLCQRLNLIDENKKYKLDNYDTFSCLKFSDKHRIFLEKMQVVFNWYINLFLKNEGSNIYRELINDVESVSDEKWRLFDFCGLDREISTKLQKRGIVHYSKFINRSLAVKFPSRHF